jgi:hypothetical protein
MATRYCLAYGDANGWAGGPGRRARLLSPRLHVLASTAPCTTGHTDRLSYRQQHAQITLHSSVVTRPVEQLVAGPGN